MHHHGACGPDSSPQRRVGACVLAGVAATSGNAEAAKNGPTLDIQLLSFNDFHGNLEPPAGSGGQVIVSDTYHEVSRVTNGVTTYSIAPDTVNAGGVEYLATHLEQARKGHPYSLTVAAGDLIGASPLLSAAFHDEPTIEAMNALKLGRLGRRATTSSTRASVSSSGCRPAAASTTGRARTTRTPAPDGTFEGADFQYLAANVKYAGTNQTILPAYTIKNIKGAKIGFIGMTLKETPTIVTASGVAGLEFTDEVADRQRARARAEGTGRQRHRRPHPPGRKPEPHGDLPRRTEHGTPDPAGEPLRLRLRQGQLRRAQPHLADHPDRRANLDPAIDMIDLGSHAPAVRL